MSANLLAQTIEGHAAAQACLFAKDCPYIATSSSWAAWLYGFGLGCNNAPIHGVKKVTQSRGYFLRVQLPNRVDLVPYPDAKAVR